MFPLRPLSMRESNALRRSLMLSKQKLKDIIKLRNTFGDKIKITDEIRFYHGTAEEVQSGKAKLFAATKGHITNVGLVNIINWITNIVGTSSTSNYGLSYSYTTTKNSAYMRVGTGSSVTTGATTSLTAQQDTAPDGQSGSVATPSGVYRISWMATWNAGTLPAITITEVGLFLSGNTSPSPNGFANYYGSTNAFLFSRLSEADGDFSSFAINTAVPLTVEWRLLFEFV